MAGLDAAAWDGLLRHARACGLLSRLAADVRSAGVFDGLPEIVRHHMRAAEIVAERQHRAVRWEVHKLRQALAPLACPIVLLKGAAYVMAGLSPARGRILGDIDLLLPRDRLDQAETLLRFAGWFGAGHDAYDQRYYREWMHELPPVTHFRRGSTLDLHHNILPLTARCKPQAERLWTGVRRLDAELHRLGDADLVIHAATHLYHEGEWGYGLRNLADIDALLREFGARDEFWTSLTARAAELDLARPLAYALRHAAALLATPMPVPALAWAQRTIGLRAGFMDGLFRRGFATAHIEFDDAWSGLARFALYVRSHWLKMPPHRLLPHLARKALRRQPEEST
ncbi:MAG: nucleotidyltransferase family protein [Betaproteobacteria bacterium]|nr:nucleotidyltransferase family protein [Betaproteobacteria bacterium]